MRELRSLIERSKLRAAFDLNSVDQLLTELCLAKACRTIGHVMDVDEALCLDRNLHCL